LQSRAAKAGARSARTLDGVPARRLPRSFFTIAISVCHHEAVLELDRELSFGSLPRNRRVFPARLDLAQHEPDEFGRRFLAGKVPADSDRLAYLRVEALDRVGGVNDFLSSAAKALDESSPLRERNDGGDFNRLGQKMAKRGWAPVI
jgi:hypothetical protein